MPDDSVKTGITSLLPPNVGVPLQLINAIFGMKGLERTTIEDVNERVADWVAKNPTMPDGSSRIREPIPTQSEQATYTTEGKPPQEYVEVPPDFGATRPADIIEGTYTDDDGSIWVYDALGYRWKVQDGVSDIGGGGGGSPTPAEPEPTSPPGEGPVDDTPGFEPFDYDVYDSSEQVDPNHAERNDDEIIWTHRNPDGSVVAGNVFGEIWEVEPAGGARVPATPFPTVPETSEPVPPSQYPNVDLFPPIVTPPSVDDGSGQGDGSGDGSGDGNGEGDGSGEGEGDDRGRGVGDAFLSGVLSGYRDVDITPPDPAEIEYLFDVGGDSIFAPTTERPYENLYSTFENGGIVDKTDLDELLRILGY